MLILFRLHCRSLAPVQSLLCLLQFIKQMHLPSTFTTLLPETNPLFLANVRPEPQRFKRQSSPFDEVLWRKAMKKSSTVWGSTKESKSVTWWFTRSQPVRLYQGEYKGKEDKKLLSFQHIHNKKIGKQINQLCTNYYFTQNLGSAFHFS